MNYGRRRLLHGRQQTALRAICSVRKGESVEETLVELRTSRPGTQFDYERSPLRHLEFGLRLLRRQNIQSSVRFSRSEICSAVDRLAH